MASRPAAREAVPTLASCLEEVRAGDPAPVYLLDGDPFLTLRAARELARALVAEGQRSLNLVELDAAASPAEVTRELATRGLFGGPKAVLLAEPAFLQSREGSGEVFERARAMWAEGRQREAARRLVALAAAAGWTAADLDPSRPGAPGPEDWKRELSVEVDETASSFLAEVARYAVERGLQAGREDASALESLLQQGLPPGHVLLVAAGKVDGRLPLVKRLAAVRRVTLAVEKQGAWDAQRPVLAPILETLLEGTGKRVDGEAEARLAELVGGDVRVLAAELAKLASYVGDRAVIRGDDVDALVARAAPDPFFALSGAVEARQLPQALGVLRRSLEDGASPHALLGSLAGAVRRLLVERERARAAAGDRRLESFGDWSAAVLASIPPEELEGRKPYGFWMRYQASLRFSRAELCDALAQLAEADVALKTGGDGPVVLERFLLALLPRSQPQRRSA